ncbi:MAG TPA: hypothetical protein VHV08_07530 [Pirellulales bacterium]|nr:hypothetical protein [Pirellulales bacterium]
MELREALLQIAEIRRHMAKSDVFRGYRSAPVALSGLLALAAACVQARFIPEPADRAAEYLTLWIGAAILSMAAVAAEMSVRLYLTHERGHLELARLAIEQFLPCVIAGALVTAVLVRLAPQNLSLLPGLWQVLFSLGIFASARLLPKPLFAIGAFYLMSGIVVLIWSRDGSSLAPWCMGVPFAVGQAISAFILYWTLERRA